MHVAAVIETKEKLMPALTNLKKTLEVKSKDFSKIIKIGRTHCQVKNYFL